MGLSEGELKVGKIEMSKAPKTWLEDCDCRLIRSITELKSFLEKGESKTHISFDFETTSLDPWTCKVVGVGLAWNGVEGVYVPLNHQTGQALNIPEAEVWAVLNPTLEKKTILVYRWQFEGHILRRVGVTTENFKDMEPTCWLADMDEKEHGLKVSAKRHLGIDMPEIESVPGSTVKEGRSEVIHFEGTHPEDAYWYGVSDVLCTYRLFEQLEPKVRAKQGQNPSIVDLENAMVGVVVQMTENAIMIDREFLKRSLVDAEKWQNIAEKKVLGWLKKSKGEIDLDSPAQLAEAMTQVGVELPRTAPTKRFPNGQLTTAQKALSELRRDNKELDEKMTDLDLFRSLGKDRSTYIARMLESTSESNPHIRVRINTCGAPTGRMSSGGGDGEDGYAKLNSQAIPAPDDELELECMLVKNPEKEKGPVIEN